MKRSQALTPLSHDHQHALATALELSRATPETAAAAAATFIAFWREEGSHHFREEEDILLPAMARHMPAEHEAIVRVLTDHVEIRRRAHDVEHGEAGVGRLQELGALLRDHVRHEERVLFPLAEDALPASELEQIGVSLSG